MPIPPLPNHPDVKTSSPNEIYIWLSWYNRVLMPWYLSLFEDAVEVYGDARSDTGLWSKSHPDYALNQTHSALLINVKPLKSETAAVELTDKYDALAAELEHAKNTTIVVSKHNLELSEENEKLRDTLKKISDCQWGDEAGAFGLARLALREGK